MEPSAFHCTYAVLVVLVSLELKVYSDRSNQQIKNFSAEVWKFEMWITVFSNLFNQIKENSFQVTSARWDGREEYNNEACWNVCGVGWCVVLCWVVVSRYLQSRLWVVEEGNAIDLAILSHTMLSYDVNHVAHKSYIISHNVDACMYRNNHFIN